MTDLHAQIMNIPCAERDFKRADVAAAYRLGHKAARHAAAELVSAAAPEAAEPVATVGSAGIVYNTAALPLPIGAKLYAGRAPTDSQAGPVALSEARVLAIAEEAGVLYEGPDRCDFDGAFEPMSLRTLTRIVNLGRSALAAPSPAGRDAVEALTDRQCLLLSFAIRFGAEGVEAAVDRFIEHGAKFAVEKAISEVRAALSTPTGSQDAV